MRDFWILRFLRESFVILELGFLDDGTFFGHPIQHTWSMTRVKSSGNSSGSEISQSIFLSIDSNKSFNLV